MLFDFVYRFAKIVLLGIILILTCIIVNYKIISLSALDLICFKSNQLPDYPYVLVPGSGDSTNNYFFKGRMDAAAEIFQSKKIKKIIVSGRNDLPGYDEPADMATALIERKIPAKNIIKDYGAERTFQSIDKYNYGDSIIIVSQKSHLERALCIAKVKGVHAAGYVAADDPSENRRKKYRNREVFARVKCTWECLVFLMTKNSV
jgi:SanA protein